MEIFWKAAETLDATAFRALDGLDKWLGRDTYRKRIEKAVEHVREPQKAIRFDA